MMICGLDDDAMEWTDAIRHLDDSPHTLWEKISYIAYQIFSVLFFPLGLIRLAYAKFQEFSAKQVLLVSQVDDWKKRKIQEFFNQYWYGDVTPYNQCIRDHYQAEPISVKTPDGVRIQGTFLKNNKGTKATPTVLVFQGNGELCTQNEIVMFAKSAIEMERDVHFCIFNYRGVDEGSPLPTRVQELIIDTETVYQEIMNRFQVKTLHIVGFSLGGGVSLAWRALHPEIQGKCVTDRSFSSTQAVVIAHLPPIMDTFMGWMCDTFGWNLKSAEAWQTIEAEKLCIYSDQDPIIPPESSIVTYLEEKKAISEGQILRLQTKGYEGANHHSLPAEIYTDQHGENAWERVCKFLFDP